jgi:hypothetical protein
MRGSATIGIRWPVTISGSIAVAWAVIPVARATIIIAAPIVAAIPRAGADKHPAYEVARPVIAIGRTGIGIEAVIAVGANGCWPNASVHRAHSDAHGKLGVCSSCGKKQNPQQRDIF